MPERFVATLRWGLFWGACVALVFAALVMVVALVSGQDPLRAYPASALSLVGIYGGYAVAGGLLLGLLRHLLAPTLRDLSDGVRWGLFWGVLVAVLLSAFVWIEALFSGPDPFRARHLSPLQLSGIYAGGAVLGGFLFGLLGPLLKTLPARLLTGITIASLLVFAIGFVASPAFPVWVLLLWSSGAGFLPGGVGALVYHEAHISDIRAQADAIAHQAADERHRVRLATYPPRFTLLLLACIAVVSGVQLFTSGLYFRGGQSMELAGLVKRSVHAGEWWRLLTSTYLHANRGYVVGNLVGLFVSGRLVEAYVPRTRFPLVYLVSALAGGLASVWFLPDREPVGALGGLLGVVAFLLVVSMRRKADLTPGVRNTLLPWLGITVVIAAEGWNFIESAALLGGPATGALLGLLPISRSQERERQLFDEVLDSLGWLAAIVLVAGAALAIFRLLPGNSQSPTYLAPCCR